MSSLDKTLNIVILGLENAGKTTLARTIAGKDFIKTMTTIGMNVEIVDYRGFKIQIIDLGGQLTFRETIWSHYTTLAKGVIFVFDVFDKQKLIEAKKWFNYITSWVSEKATLIFFANKIDLKETNNNFMNTEEIVKNFGLEEISKFPLRSFRIFEISAKTGENVTSSIQWLFDRVTEGIKEDTRISFVSILNEMNEIIYTNIQKEDRLEDFFNVLSRKVQNMKEKNVKEGHLLIEDYNISINSSNQFSVIVGTKYNISEKNLRTASKSISDLIRKKYLPPENFLNQLEGIINLTLLKEVFDK
jgi:small GTP-binding protein